MAEIQPFEFNIGKEHLVVPIGRLAVRLFRTLQEVDYFIIAQDSDEPDEDYEMLNIFNNPEVARWMAGYSIVHSDVIKRPVARREGLTFRERYGWSPTVVEAESPDDEEVEKFLDVVASKIDSEWDSMS